MTHVFTQTASSALHTLSAEMRADAIFHTWTRKEAYAKALGNGLGLDLKQIDVSDALCVRNYAPNQYVNVHHSSCWSLKDLELGSGYAGSIVVEGYNWAIRCWKLEYD